MGAVGVSLCCSDLYDFRGARLDECGQREGVEGGGGEGFGGAGAFEGELVLEGKSGLVGCGGVVGD